jgi:hypothetical protein
MHYYDKNILYVIISYFFPYIHNTSYLLVCNKVELQRVKQTITTDHQLSEDKNQFTCQTVLKMILIF